MVALMEQRPKMRGREVESKSKSEIHCFFQKQKQMWNHSMIIIQIKLFFCIHNKISMLGQSFNLSFLASITKKGQNFKGLDTASLDLET